MADATILFVDDEESILRSLQRTLRKEPYRILVAGSGQQGLEILASEKVDLVVSDQRMPEMTGSEFLCEVSRRHPDTVRVILSGYAEPHVILEAINDGGIFRFLGKPWDDAHLKTNLRQCLEHHQMVQENRRLSQQAAVHVLELEKLNRQLEAAVAERTRSLAFAQEVLETLPRMVLGISRDHELVLSNASARRDLPGVAAAMPGTDINGVLPPDAVEAAHRCLETGRGVTCRCQWEDQRMSVSAVPLGPPESLRGCIMLVEEIPA